MSAGVDVRVDVLADACKRDLRDESRWITPRTFPDSLALCIIDAIYSTGASHVTVRNVIDKYTAYRSDQGGEATHDGVPELLATFDDLGDASAWATRIGNRRPTSSTPGAPLRAQAVLDAATQLAGLGINTAADLRDVAETSALELVKKAWLDVPGQRSGTTWIYTLMLSGVSGVVADRRVINYVARALDVPVGDVTPVLATALIDQVAQRNGWSPVNAEYAICRFAAGRPVHRSGVAAS